MEKFINMEHEQVYNDLKRKVCSEQSYNSKISLIINTLENKEKLENVIDSLELQSFLVLDREITSENKALKNAVVLIRRTIRKLTRWYIKPVVEQQNRYNQQLVEAIKLLSTKYDSITDLQYMKED